MRALSPMSRAVAPAPAPSSDARGEPPMSARAGPGVRRSSSPVVIVRLPSEVGEGSGAVSSERSLPAARWRVNDPKVAEELLDAESQDAFSGVGGCATAERPTPCASLRRLAYAQEPRLGASLRRPLRSDGSLLGIRVECDIWHTFHSAWRGGCEHRGPGVLGGLFPEPRSPKIEH